MNVDQEIRIPMASIAKDITLNVKVITTGERLWKWRLWLGIQCLRLGAFVAGVGIRVDHEPN